MLDAIIIIAFCAVIEIIFQLFRQRIKVYAREQSKYKFSFIEVTLSFLDKTQACKAEEFSCTSSKTCISTAWLCDGENDCPKGEDEHPSAGCGQFFSC